MILAVETSGDLCSVAVRDAQGTLVERAFRHRMHLSERLIDDVDALLADAGTTLQDLSGLAVDLGPGSFTGIRVGVMLVKTWADVLQKPVVGVTAFDTLAEEYEGIAEVVIPVIRARPGSVYAAVYRAEDSQLTLESGPEMVTITELVERIAAYDGCVVCGDGAVKHRAEIETGFAAGGARVAFGPDNVPQASMLAAIAARRFAAGQTDDALSLVPCYIAPPPIDPNAEKKAAQTLLTTKRPAPKDRPS